MLLNRRVSLGKALGKKQSRKEMPTFTSFEEIDAWQEARKLTAKIYHLTSSGALRRDFDLSRQLRRASVSVMSNIAEGSERGGDGEFIHFLSIAKGSCAEVRSQIYIAADADYLPETDVLQLIEQCRSVSRLTHGLIRYLQNSSISGPKFRNRRRPKPKT